MAELKTKTRKRLPDTAFAGPDRQLSGTDKRHAANAKARADAAAEKGKPEQVAGQQIQGEGQQGAGEEEVRSKNPPSAAEVIESPFPYRPAQARAGRPPRPSPGRIYAIPPSLLRYGYTT